MNINMGGYNFEYDKANGIIPIFQWEMRKKINEKKACNVVITGEAGIGKSYQAIQFARSLYSKFDTDCLVYTFSEFMKAVLNLGPFAPIVFDEPSYAMSHREWYKQINQALARTFQSMRFKLHPVFIPVISLDLLDKEIRDYLVQFQVMMHDRGEGVAYRLTHSEFEHKTMFNRLCEIHYGLMDNKLCSRESCLLCNNVKDCAILRARYERRKAEVQDKRFIEEMETSVKAESKNLTLDEIVEYAKAVKAKIMKGERISIPLLKLALRDTYGISIGNNRAYDVKVKLEQQEPIEDSTTA